MTDTLIVTCSVLLVLLVMSVIRAVDYYRRWQWCEEEMDRREQISPQQVQHLTGQDITTVYGSRPWPR